MSPAIAQFVLLAITACATVAWLFALWGWARVARAGPGESEETDPAGGRRVVGVRSKLTSGEASDLADGLLRTLATGGGLGVSPVIVKREGPLAITARTAAPVGMTSVPAFSACRIELRPAGLSGTELVFRADYTDARRKALLVSGILLGVGLAVIVGLAAFLWLAVLPAESKALRSQVVQAMQMVHVLWPPWLIYALYRRSRRATDMFLDAAAANASALAEAFAAGRRKAAGQ